MSLKRQITILFLLSTLLMLIFGVWLEKIYSQKSDKIIISNYLIGSKELLNPIFNLNSREFNRKLEELNLELVSKESGEIIFKKELGVGEILIFRNKKGLFLKIDYLDEEYYLFDKRQLEYRKEQFITTLFILFNIAILLIIYILVLKIVSPIKRLAINMDSFAKGNFNIRVEEKGAKEILVAQKSFNKMAEDLKRAIEDRENLMRYFGHEIKTPLAKAKYAYEKRELELLNRAILQIERFVDEVFNLHLINSKNLKKENFLATTLIVEALNRTQIERESDIKIEIIDDFKIYGDLNYLGIALKNLIDNALKYSTKLPIKIRTYKNRIEVINSSKRLDKSLDYYTKAFTKNSSYGYGLGLYLVKIILDKHNFKLEYRYESKKNIFQIIFI